MGFKVRLHNINCMFYHSLRRKPCAYTLLTIWRKIRFYRETMKLLETTIVLLGLLWDHTSTALSTLDKKPTFVS